MDVKQKEQVKRIAHELIPIIIRNNHLDYSEIGTVDAAFRIAKYFVKTCDRLDYEQE